MWLREDFCHTNDTCTMSNLGDVYTRSPTCLTHYDLAVMMTGAASRQYKLPESGDGEEPAVKSRHGIG